MLKLILAEMRPQQWIKNFFVFAALIFAKKLFYPEKVAAAIAGFIIFCLISSSVYVINDIYDADEDNVHPVKKNRPVASGKLKLSTAVMTAIVLILISLLWSFLESPWFSLIILAYFLLNLAYSMLLKHKVVIDIIIVALCFVLRVIGGAVIIDVSTSNWLILCTLFISLFIGFSKRRNEIIILEDDANRHRKVLEEYSPAFLDQMISVVSALTIMSYALYTVSPETVTKFGTGNLIYTVPFVIYGIFRYFYLVYKKELGGSPTRIMYTDRPLIAAVFIWMITCSIIIYIK
jgi:4-hydroxybenzoate polyprenyltransferase